MRTAETMPAGKRLILDAGESLIAQHGYDALRLRDISAATGLSIGAIQHHFSTRDEAAAAMMRHSCIQRMAGWRSSMDGADDAAQRLGILLSTAVSSHEHCALWLETCAAATRHHALVPLIQETNDAWMSLLEEQMRQLHAEGQTPKVPAEPGSEEARAYLASVAEVLVIAVDGFIVSVGTHSTRLSAERAHLLLARTADAWLGTRLSDR